MKVDTFTRIVLLAILMLLCIIGFRPSARVDRVQAGQGGLDHVKPLGIVRGGSFLLLDNRNGDLWLYPVGARYVEYMGTLIELGKPLQAKQ
jgi:hypothetical protein